MSTAITNKVDKEPGGLISALLVNGETGVQELGWTELNNCRIQENEWLWGHLDYTQSAAQEWMYKHSGLTPLTAEALLQA